MAKILKHEIVRRTFKAKNYPKGSPERIKYNKDPLTSEYMTSYKYLLRAKIQFNHGGISNIRTSYPTKKLALKGLKSWESA